MPGEYRFKVSAVVGSLAKRVKASFLRRPCCMIVGSTGTLVSLLRPWIRRFTMIISAWWLRTSSKFMWEEVKGQPENLENGQLLSGCGFIQRIAPPSLSRERRIKIHQSIKSINPKVNKICLSNYDTKNFIPARGQKWIN